MEWMIKIVYALILIGVVMTLAGYSVLAERKVSAWIQRRVGPNRTALPFLQAIPVLGPFLQRLGIWQPLADGLKFLFKEDPIPGHVNKVYYVLAPLIAFVPALCTITVVPFGLYWDAAGVAHPLILADVDIGILFVLAISSLSVYGIVLGGWASNNKYAFLGGIRSSAQLISYELALGLSILPVFLWANPPGSTSGLTLSGVVACQERIWLIFVQPLSALIFLVALFAETNRLPFDMPESESELVGGFHTEYGSFKFGLFFVAEYAHMVVGSAVFVLLFLGGWHFLPGLPIPWPHAMLGSFCSIGWFLAKVLLCMFFFIWIRWTLPRFRYDHVMQLGWKALLPLAILNFLVYILLVPIIDTL